MEIVYCEKCGDRIDADDLKDGGARQTEGGVLCPKCAPTVLPVGASKKSSKAMMPAVRSPRPPSSDERGAVRRPSARARNTEKNPSYAGGMIALAVAAGLFLLAGVYFAIGSTRRPQNFDNDKPKSPPQTSSQPAQPASTTPASRPDSSPSKADTPHTAGSGSMALSMLTNSADADREQAEYSKLFDGIKADDTPARIKKLEDFVRRLSPDSDLGPRARVALRKLKSTPGGQHITEPPPPPAAEKAVLIGRWKLDEGSGDTVADASGNKQSGKCTSGPQWKENGMYFDGKESFIALPNSDALDHVQEGDYSVCAWFKPDQDPAEEADHVHCGYSIVVKPGRHTGIFYYRGGYFTMDAWGNNGERFFAPSRSYPPGVLYHVCGTLSRRTGETRLYINGKLEKSTFWDNNIPAKSYGSEIWKIGTAYSNNTEWGWPAKGLIKDARVYKGALTDAEVEAIAREK